VSPYDYAHWFASRPLPRFPCYPNKRPACPNGFHDASADPARLVALWAGRTGLLVAVPTGEASGIAVLDIDVAGLGWLAAAGLPPTRQHQTRSGGRHFIYRHRPGLRCSQGVIAPGVDVRGDGGYVIWWPAHGFASGGEIADWPEGLLDLRPAPREAPQRELNWQNGCGASLGDAPVREASGFIDRTRNDKIGLEHRLAGILRAVERAPEGERNKTLYWAARRFAEFIAEGLMTRPIAEQVLESAARICGLVSDDGLRAVRATIGSGLGERENGALH